MLGREWQISYAMDVVAIVDGDSRPLGKLSAQRALHRRSRPAHSPEAGRTIPSHVPMHAKVEDVPRREVGYCMKRVEYEFIRRLLGEISLP